MHTIYHDLAPHITCVLTGQRCVCTCSEHLQLFASCACRATVTQHLTLLDGASDEQQVEWERSGFEQIARGRVAAVLIATTAVDSHALNPRGEDMPIEVEDGTPRVAVPVIGLPSGKSTLQLLAERILKVQQLAAAETFGRNAPVTRHVQWYVLEQACCHTMPVQLPVLFDATLDSSLYAGQAGRQVLFC